MPRFHPTTATPNLTQPLQPTATGMSVSPATLRRRGSHGRELES